MMAIRVRAPVLSPLRPALRLAGPARPVIGLQGRRTARAAPRGRRAAADQSAAPAGLGRPGGPRRADPAAAATASDAPAGHSRHRPAVAPPPCRPQVDLSPPDGPATGQRRDRRADRAARHREPRLGYQRIQGELLKLGHRVSASSQPPAPPAPARPPPADLSKDRIRRQPVLGGLISEYQRAA